ncbi:MAG: MBL fold metallo-hydrolase [Bdellovibrionales bacterium]|nr:MBL fold metallo-hydrolase [Bdellovibrionales bacterium]
MSIEIQILGPRGSLAIPMTPREVEHRVQKILEDYNSYPIKDVRQFLTTLPISQLGGYGGNTACIRVEAEDTLLYIDAGTGIRKEGAQLMSGPCGKGQGEVHLMFTHFHWDHIVGLPFFVPIFVPGNKIHVYAVQDDLEKMFRHVFCKPYFPVPYEALGADIIYHKLEPRKPVKFGEIQVTPYELDHPDPCWGYRFDYKGKSFSYAVDNEGVRASRSELGPDLPMYQDLDLLIFDAQYTFKEATERVDWGHSSAPIGLDIAMREGVKRVIFVHHDPAASDKKISETEEQTAKYYRSMLKAAKRVGEDIFEVEWEFAQEGLTINL